MNEKEVGMKSLRAMGFGVALTLVIASAQCQTADKRYLILLVGPTGSGKTTQAELLKQRFGITTISVEDLIQGARPGRLSREQGSGGPSRRVVEEAGFAAADRHSIRRFRRCGHAAADV